MSSKEHNTEDWRIPSRDVFITLRDRLEKARVTWAIFAGAAAHAYGSSRAITDIDILVKKSDAPEVEAALGLMTDRKGIVIDSIELVSEVELGINGRTIRFFMDEEMEKRLRTGELFGVRVWLVPPEDNVILKAILQRGPDQGKYDVQDILDMAKNPIDRNYLEKKINFYGVEDIVRPLLSKLNIL